MSNGKEFGYPQGEPHAPFHLRADVQIKCGDCGTLYTGHHVCLRGNIFEQHAKAQAIARSLENEAADTLAHYESGRSR